VNLEFFHMLNQALPSLWAISLKELSLSSWEPFKFIVFSSPWPLNYWWIIYFKTDFLINRLILKDMVNLWRSIV
jgi:hypothetical protein